MNPLLFCQDYFLQIKIMIIIIMAIQKMHAISHSHKKHTKQRRHSQLGGGFNPSEKYARQTGSFPQVSG